jgi:hypothetical protein
MNDWQEEKDARVEPLSAAQINNRRLFEGFDDEQLPADHDAFLREAPDIPRSNPLPPSNLSESSHGDEAEHVDHPDAKTAREWATRKEALGFARREQGGLKRAWKGSVGALGNAITRIGAAGAQDSYTAGKVLGGIGGVAKGVTDTTKDLSKIGQGVDLAAGLKGENSILNQNIPYLGFNMNTIAKAEFAPGIKVTDAAKAALQDGGTLLEVAGRGITAASGREALDFGDDERRKYMDRREAFQAKKREMRERLDQEQHTQRGQLTGTTQAAVRQLLAARKLGKAVNEYGIRPEYEYSMKETADINNMTVQRTAQSREANGLQVKPGEVTFERNAGTDPLNAAPDYQTNEELAAGKSAKRWAAPGEALEGLGRIVDGSEHGQEAVRKGEYLKGSAQAALAGARTIGKGAATVAAAPLGLGLATSALVDVGTVAAGGLLQGVGAGINAATGVGEKADKQRALELRNKHYFGKEHFLKEVNAAGGVAGAAPAEEPKQEAEAPEHKDAIPSDPFFDSARARRIAERGLRTRDPLKEGDYEKGDRDAGLPAIDHGGAFKNFWHNRLKRPLKKVGQGFLKPVSLMAKLGGYLTGAIPLYNYFQNKKRKKASEAATNRVNNRLGGRLSDQVDDDSLLANHPDEKQAPAAPQYAGPQAQDGVLRSLEGRQAQAELNRVELRRVLDLQNESHESATKSRNAGAALKMSGRDLRKENVSAWQDFERTHNEQRLTEKIADRKRERAPDPATGESFLEKQKREYLEWFDKTKRFDYADAHMGSAIQRYAATDPRPIPSEAEEGKSESNDDGGSLDGAMSESEGDVGSMDGERSSRHSVDLNAGRWAGPLESIPEVEGDDDFDDGQSDTGTEMERMGSVDLEDGDMLEEMKEEAKEAPDPTWEKLRRKKA